MSRAKIKTRFGNYLKARAQKRNSISRKRRVLNHLSQICMALISISLMTSPVSAVDAEVAKQAIGNEGGLKATKSTLQVALTLARGKPALSVATGIVCLSCAPTAGITASPGMCVACGILIAKTFG